MSESLARESKSIRMEQAAREIYLIINGRTSQRLSQISISPDLWAALGEPQSLYHIPVFVDFNLKAGEISIKFVV